MLLSTLQGGNATVSIDEQVVDRNVTVPVTAGFVGFGTSGYFAAEFDAFKLYSGKLCFKNL